MKAFALEVVTRLREAGFSALWAGGCVRDLLLGSDPHDYDVATDARPAEVQKLFKRTIAVGAQFGVIELLGLKGLHVQVATFRSDGKYSDGRHPDSVRFGSAEEDAKRRDFTINGLFLDPISDQVIDYVGGQEDLSKRVVRAIGDPRARITEDKLRMLRAIRFVARLGFTLDDATATAIRELHPDLTQVSPERITDELKKMLVHPSRSTALSLLVRLRLFPVLLPEFHWSPEPPADAFFLVRHLPSLVSFPLAWAAVLLDCQRLMGPADVLGSNRYLDDLSTRFRLSNDEKAQVAFLVKHLAKVRSADSLAWSELKPLLAHPGRDELLTLLEAECAELPSSRPGLAYCRDKLRDWPPEQLDPPPLVTGEDVASLRVPKGPAYKHLLEEVRNAQLNETITTRENALELLKNLASERLNSDAGRTDN
jgi:tRNA nucleotidyltransferase/poly(A) polymerase